MTRFLRRILLTAAVVAFAAALFGALGLPGAFGQSLPPIEESAVEGGLAVWIGGEEAPADWAAGLSKLDARKGLLVLGLGRDTEVVRKTRAALGGLGRRGTLSLDTFQPPADGALPLVDDTVNLLVVSSGVGAGSAEILRVLAPLGTALVEESGKWHKITKPWPADIDEWTHYLHDASNNAVSHDRRVGPPRHLQWQCGPRWGRHHDHMASVSAMVSARGRVFYIVDEGSRLSPQLPPHWKLVARGAFNGVLLWKRPIARWHDNLWPLKSGPASLPRRLVAQGDVVYATLGIDAPVTALDAATGRTLREYEGTASAEEIICSDGTLLVLVNRTPVDLEADLATDPEEGRSRDSRTTYSPTMGRIWAGVRSRRWTYGDRSILAFEAETGRPLWEKADRVIPLTLGADAGGAYYHDGDKIVALDVAGGRQRWVSPPVPVWQGLHGRGLQSWFAPTLVASEGKVLFAGGEKMHMSYQGWGSEDIGQDTMTAFSADSGEKLWTADHPYSGYNSPEDLFVTRGKVWTGVTAKGGPGGRYMSHDLATGEKDDDFPPTVDTFWFHHRCYRAKATDKYILSSRTGIEFVDLATGEWTIHHWVRGGCLYGIMPSNGLVYSPLHPCSCYAEAKLNGFTALAASRGEGRGVRDEGRGVGGEGLGVRGEGRGVRGEGRAVRGSHDPAHGSSEGLQNPGDLRSTVSARSGDLRRARAARLERGPAYPNLPLPAGQGRGEGVSALAPTSHPTSLAPHPSAWPTYRHDPARSGATSDSISTPLGPQWTVELGGRLTQPVAGDGRLFVADADRHAVHAVDADSGERLWSYTAGGRIDSPPTYDRGRLVFGSANGYVYCLRADDGALAWRFRAAPVDRRLVAFDSVESVWPVHGAVLVEDGVVSAVAGRSIFLDGGLRFCRLDVETGRLLSETVLDDRDPETGENMQTRVKGLDMPVALPDVLASDGERLYMRSETLDLEGNRLGAASPGGGRDHLFAPYGFTDDSWFHRVYWVFGNGFRSGVGGYSNGLAKPAGRILVNNDATVFGYGRKPQYYRWTSVREYQLFAAVRPGSQGGAPKAKPGKRKSKVAYRWARNVPMMVCGMALADKTLLIAGPPDLIDEEASFQNFPDEATQKQLALQEAALKGQGGAMLRAVDADTGETLAECPLDSPPVFDGLIVAGGRVFLTTMDGRLRAFAQKGAAR